MSAPTTTAGVDLASQAQNTAACVMEWGPKGGRVAELNDHCDDDDIVRLLARANKVGIDIPLGWPIAFAKAMELHARDGSWPVDYRHADNQDFRYRQTDRWLKECQHLSLPLSVSTDRIAIPAMRAAAILNRAIPHCALDGSGVVVEVYPAAALSRWGFVHQGYKGANNAACRTTLVDTFCQRTEPWLTFSNGQQIELCRSNDNVFDALVAALVARAHRQKKTEAIPKEHADAAKHEGWIALPKVDSLEQLV
ncbi:MAG: DUF429 domain-containing protein [Acidimicrobiales bacterium]